MRAAVIILMAVAITACTLTPEQRCAATRLGSAMTAGQQWLPPEARAVLVAWGCDGHGR